MKTKLAFIILIFAALFLWQCSKEEVNQNLTQEITADYDNETDENFVSQKQALKIAEKFLSNDP